jgi:hypothetical protein
VLLDMLVVENRAGIAECRLGVRAVIRQILYDAEYGPCQRQYYANNQQQNNRNFHGGTRQKLERQS